jgi:hypothetical protein
VAEAIVADIEQAERLRDDHPVSIRADQIRIRDRVDETPRLRDFDGPCSDLPKSIGVFQGLLAIGGDS